MQDVASTFGAADDGARRGRARRPRRRSSSGSPCCAACSTAARSYEPGTIAFRRPRPARRSTCTGRSPSTTTRRDRPLPRRGRATSTSKASSPRTRWPRCRPSSTTRSPPPSATTARRGGRAPSDGRVVPGADPRLQPAVADAARRCCAATASASIGSFTDDTFVQRDPDVGDSAEGLLKKIGVVEGISDVSWHKDCSMGGHSRALLRAHGRDLGDRRRTRERRARRGRRFASRQRSRARRRRTRPAAGAVADPHRRRHGALLVHAAHEPAAGVGRAPGRLHRLRPRARGPATTASSSIPPRSAASAPRSATSRSHVHGSLSERAGSFEL